MNGKSLYVQEREEPVYIQLQTPAMPVLPAFMRNSIYRFNELAILWTALHLAERNQRILISITQEPERTMGWYKDALELDDWHDVSNFELPEEEGLLSCFQKALEVCIDYCGEDSYEVALLNKGIATNHGQMPQRLRRLMTDLVDKRICPITVATATLTEGVNLPFDIIFLTSLKRRWFNSGTEPDNAQQVITPLSISEFNNLAGRAGRPGSAKGTEGMTLIAVPQRPSTTAQGQLRTQRRQIRDLKGDYNNLRDNLLRSERDEENLISPLALLLKTIAERAYDVFRLEGDQFIDWLEAAIPFEISENAGTGGRLQHDCLADSIDELDNILLSAIEQLSRIQNQDLDGPEAEVHLANLWQNTFTNFAAVHEAWLEQAFIRRGRALIQTIYPDSNERKRLYQYGFTPYVGRRFENVALAIRSTIEDAIDYGTASLEERLAIFISLGELLKDDRGFGFQVRDTVSDQNLLENWQDLFAWWMQGDSLENPEPRQLRSWQRFVSINFEFRLGMAIGGVVSQAWFEGSDDPQSTPTLATWRETTGLPWFGFWARELLRWGTLDPFVAFALAKGLAQTRVEAASRRPEFETWLEGRSGIEVNGENLVDPQLLQEWYRSLNSQTGERTQDVHIEVELTGTTGEHGSYNVLPIINNTNICWIDPAGYELARSDIHEEQIDGRELHDDFELQINNGVAYIRRSFTKN